MKVKVCGITNLEDALLAVELGADALGFIFYEKSPRYITPSLAQHIVGQLPPFVTKVGVFVDASFEEVKDISLYVGLTALQIHAQFQDDHFSKLGVDIISAIQVKTIEDLSVFQDVPMYVKAVVLDTKKEGLYGGTGDVFDWKIAVEAKSYGKPIILSGGLNPENIVTAIHTVHPYAVDVSSGLESKPGKKSPEKMMAFFERIRTL